MHRNHSKKLHMAQLFTAMLLALFALTYASCGKRINPADAAAQSGGVLPANNGEPRESGGQARQNTRESRIVNGQNLQLSFSAPAEAILPLLPEGVEAVSGDEAGSVLMWIALSNNPISNLPIQDGQFHQFLLGANVVFEGTEYAFPLFHVVDDALILRGGPQLAIQRSRSGKIELEVSETDIQARVSVDRRTILEVQLNTEGTSLPVPQKERSVLSYRPDSGQLVESKSERIVNHEIRGGIASMELCPDRISDPEYDWLNELAGSYQVPSLYQLRDSSFREIGLVHSYTSGEQAAGQFPTDFPVLEDEGGLGAGNPITGFGGDISINRRQHRSLLANSDKRPVVLLHGNGSPSDIWKRVLWPGTDDPGYSVYDGLRDAGYDDAHIWALNYQGPQGTLSGARAFDTPAKSNIEDVRAFIDAVLEYTGSDEVDIIAVSLGCHMARGYVLGLQSDGSFDPRERRLDKVASVVLISGANYGLGNVPMPDFASNSPLFASSTADGTQNSFMLIDGKLDLTPDEVDWFTLYPEYDFPQALYLASGGGHPLNPQHTSQLGDAPAFIIPPDYVGGWYVNRSDAGKQWYADPMRYLYANHVYGLFDRSIVQEQIVSHIHQ